LKGARSGEENIEEERKKIQKIEKIYDRKK
jgi:hypothetical protein